MTILWTIIIGFIVGLVARLLMPGRDPAGFIVTTVLGIIGAVVGKYIGQGLGFYGPEDAAGFTMSVIGAIIVLGIYHMLFRGTRSTTTTGI